MTRARLYQARQAVAAMWVLVSAALMTVVSLALSDAPIVRNLNITGQARIVVAVLLLVSTIEAVRAVVAVRQHKRSQRSSIWETPSGTLPVPSSEQGQEEHVDSITAPAHAYRALDVRLREALAELEALRLDLQKSLNDNAQKEKWLEHQDEEIRWLKSELEKRAKIVRKVYKILTLGMKGTGKTALTLKWANPLIDLGALSGTVIERYERSVSHIATEGVLTEHVFEVGDWDGEHIVDAQAELMQGEISGLLLVVDLAGPGSKEVDPKRIQQQLTELNTQTLRFLFAKKALESCKAVVLFINKSDVISGTPSEVEQKARSLYSDLIAELEVYREQVDIRVMVGSATFGHSTHHLFAHFTSKILPPSAYDSQLLQRMKASATSDKVPTSTTAAELPLAADGGLVAPSGRPSARRS